MKKKEMKKLAERIAKLESIIEANEDEEKKTEWLKTAKQQFMLDSQEILNTQVSTAEAT